MFQTVKVNLFWLKKGSGTKQSTVKRAWLVKGGVPPKISALTEVLNETEERLWPHKQGVNLGVT